MTTLWLLVVVDLGINVVVAVVLVVTEQHQGLVFLLQAGLTQTVFIRLPLAEAVLEGHLRQSLGRKDLIQYFQR